MLVAENVSHDFYVLCVHIGYHDTKFYPHQILAHVCYWHTEGVMHMCSIVMWCTYMYMKTANVRKCLETDRMFFEMRGEPSGDIYMYDEVMRRWHLMWLSWALEALYQSAWLPSSSGCGTSAQGGIVVECGWNYWGNREVVPTASHWYHVNAIARHSEEYNLCHISKHNIYHVFSGHLGWIAPLVFPLNNGGGDTNSIYMYIRILINTQRAWCAHLMS